MAGGIFLIDGDKGLVKMEEKAYDSDALLQELLQKLEFCLPFNWDSCLPLPWEFSLPFPHDPIKSVIHVLRPYHPLPGTP